MNCDAFIQNLDALMDDALSQDAEAQLKAHAQKCPSCADALLATYTLRDGLKQLDESAVVPLDAQAAWRKAVRSEAKPKRSRIRALGGIAAAICILFAGGATFTAQRNDAIPSSANVMFETDSAEMMMSSAKSAAPVGYREIHVLCEDVETAKGNLSNLCAEFEAAENFEATEGSAEELYVSLDPSQGEAFLSSLGTLGEVVSLENDGAEEAPGNYHIIIRKAD